MQVAKAKCPKCGNLNYILPSNNPLVEGICIGCVNKTLDAARIEHFAFFCRTYNIPFQPNTYMILYKQFKSNVFAKYIETLVDKGTLSYTDATTDTWKDVEKEWSKVKTFDQMALKIESIREAFESRARIKWGIDYTFGELIQLENLYINTVKAYDITDPMRLDSIKKACKLSVKLDAMIESGEAKSIKDYSSAYQSFLKSAQIDEFAQVATEGTVKTVADLYKYMEKNGFEFNFYDKEERDIVDKTINDFKKIIVNEVRNTTGLDLKLQTIAKTFNANAEGAADNEAIAKVALDELYDDDYYEDLEQEADKEFENQTLEDIEYD